MLDKCTYVCGKECQTTIYLSRFTGTAVDQFLFPFTSIILLLTLRHIGFYDNS